jgi:hypothetical protein
MQSIDGLAAAVVNLRRSDGGQQGFTRSQVFKMETDPRFFAWLV